MTHDEALQYLKSRERFGIKFGLENIDRLAKSLGRPERRYTSILIAGTNGKGSTAALLESILRASGYRTGRYTSPHIRFLEERIQVGGEPIPRKALSGVVSRVAAAAADLGRELTFFEAVTACAFAYFGERGIETAVLEVGMGGRFDATNIVPAAVSVITPIGFDHERFLGDTIAAIASEKAAIIKENRPVVVGNLLPDALAVVREEAERKKAPLFLAMEGVEFQRDETSRGQSIRLRTPERDYGRLELPLRGEHQVENLTLAVRVAEIAHRSQDRFPRSLSLESVRDGVAGTLWQSRLERIEATPPMLLDAAHNVMAAEALHRFLDAHPHPKRVLLFGVMKDKRVHEMLALLMPHACYFVATRPRMSRSRGPEPLAAWARQRGMPAEALRSSAAALRRAREIAGPDGEILVAGSIFLLGEIQNELAREREAAPAITA